MCIWRLEMASASSTPAGLGMIDDSREACVVCRQGRDVPLQAWVLFDGGRKLADKQEQYQNRVQYDWWSWQGSLILCWPCPFWPPRNVFYWRYQWDWCESGGHFWSAEMIAIRFCFKLRSSEWIWCFSSTLRWFSHLFETRLLATSDFLSSCNYCFQLIPLKALKIASDDFLSLM